MNFEPDEFERMLRQFRPRKPRPLPQPSSVRKKYRAAHWLIPAVAVGLLVIVSIPHFWNVRALSAADPIILSDTHGYDFTNYLNRLTDQVRRKWYERIPDTVRLGRQQGRVVLIFTVLRDGTSQNVRIVAGSGAASLDQAAASAVQSASPFSRLPDDFNDTQIIVQLTFSYNQG
jgi:TonB family protein